MDQLAGLTEEARKLALDRFRLLQPHLEDDRPLKAVAAAAKIPFRSAQRWVSLYRQFGLTALARKKRTDTGQHREISARLKAAIEGIALQKPPIPVAALCRQASRLAQDLGEEAPMYWLFHRIVAAVFSAVNEMFLCQLHGYAPAGGVVRGKPTLTLAELDTRFRAFLLDVYHRRENTETKMRPVERWEANGFLPRMPGLAGATGPTPDPGGQGTSGPG